MMILEIKGLSRDNWKHFDKTIYLKFLKSLGALIWKTEMNKRISLVSQTWTGLVTEYHFDLHNSCSIHISKSK